MESSLGSLAQASLASLASFVVGAGIPLLAAVFSEDQQIRLACVLVRPAFPSLDSLQQLQMQSMGVLRCAAFCEQQWTLLAKEAEALWRHFRANALLFRLSLASLFRRLRQLLPCCCSARWARGWAAPSASALRCACSLAAGWRWASLLGRGGCSAKTPHEAKLARALPQGFLQMWHRCSALLIPLGGWLATGTGWHGAPVIARTPPKLVASQIFSIMGSFWGIVPRLRVLLQGCHVQTAGARCH